MIPKPARSLSNYPIRKLRGAYDWSCKQFRALRDSCRVQDAIRDAEERYLDKSEKTLDQSPAQWEKFKLDIVAKFPEIEDFEDNWPLFVILSTDRKLEKQFAARNLARTQRGRSGYNAGHRRMYVGKPLPRRNVNYTPLNFTPAPSTDNDVAISGHFVNGDAMAESAPEVVMTAGNSQLTPQYVRTTNSEESTEESHNSNGGAVQSPSTSHVPVISHAGSNNTQIIAVCRNQKPLIDALALLGIISDKHLLILSKLAKWGAGPVEFFESLPNDKLPHLYNITVLKNIKNDQFNALNEQSRSHGSQSHDRRRPSNEDSPSLLQTLLNRFDIDMEELIPLFHAARVTTDVEFMMLRGLDEAQRLAIFDDEDFTHVRPFQRWILDFFLRHIDMTEGVDC